LQTGWVDEGVEHKGDQGYSEVADDAHHHPPDSNSSGNRAPRSWY
jgi:hypothetical protein